MRDSRLLLKDIIDAISAIEKFTDNISYEEFVSNDEKLSAVIRKFEIIGEATKALPDDLKNTYPEIPWKEMAGFRDKLIHFYFGIKYELVWRAIKNRLPGLKESIQRIMSNI